MATFSGVSHISFSVRDSETSARWWAALLDLTEIDRVSGDGWRAFLLLPPPPRTVIEFQQHDGNQGETFDPLRTDQPRHRRFLASCAAIPTRWSSRSQASNHLLAQQIKHQLVTTVAAAQLRSAVRARVWQDPYVAALGPAHDDVVVTHAPGDIVTGLWDLALVTDEQP